ncbi:MAG: DHH family phosphoesterase [Actinobacteria bacterium]|nr:DHH family phosphoesterase [Actinomycetota bacterium]
MTIPAADFNRAARAIQGAKSLSLACHQNPDGDALGSMFALHHLARAHGVPVVSSWPSPFVVAPHYRYLPGLDQATKPGDYPERPELMITFDCGSLARLGDLAGPARAAGELIVLDHHASNDRYGSINVVDTDAAATAVVVRELARRLGWELTRDAAQCLYTGLVCDTGRFQYESTSPDVFSLAEELSKFDLPIASMNRQLFEEHRFAYIKLISMALDRAQLDREAGFVCTWVTLDDLARFGVEIDEIEGLIDLVRRTAEAEVACVIRETTNGVKVSLRSLHDFDVGAIAMRLGGGGHRHAAGFESEDSVQDVLAKIRTAVAQASRLN